MERALPRRIILAVALLVATSSVATSQARAEDATKTSYDPGRPYKRAAWIEGSIALALLGGGVTLIARHPHESVELGFGIGTLVWGAAFGAEAVLSLIDMRRVQRDPRWTAITRSSSVERHAVNLGLAALVPLIGAAAIGVGELLLDDKTIVGAGASYVAFGVPLLVFAGVQLWRVKRTQACRDARAKRLSFDAAGLHF